MSHGPARSDVSNFLWSCIALCAVGVVALVTIVFLSLVVKVGVEYLEWLFSWKIIGA